jgi:hypothetical protein
MGRRMIRSIRRQARADAVESVGSIVETIEWCPKEDSNLQGREATRT